MDNYRWAAVSVIMMILLGFFSLWLDIVPIGALPNAIVAVFLIFRKKI